MTGDDLPGDVLGPDGVLRRRAARVVVLDRRGRVLLFRGSDPGRPDAGTWWFTAGGGAEAGEDLREAAVREVKEEAGLDVVGRLVGPVRTRDVVFEFEGRRVEQTEAFFVARLDLDGDDLPTDRSGWTDLERRSVHEQRWWTVAELGTTADTVFPTDLVEMLTP